MAKPQSVIAITGLGCVSPLGNDVETASSSYLHSASGVGLINDPWANDLPCRLAARVNLDLRSLLGEFLCNRLDRCGQLAVVAAREAWNSAKLEDGAIPPERIAIVLGTGIGGQSTLLAQHQRLLQQAKRIHPLSIVMSMPNAASAQLAIEFGATGGAHTPVSACASGAEAIAWGRLLLATDEADIVIAGGAEAVIHPVNIRSFAEMRALSCRHQDPQKACRPFAADRSGFVLGEGAGIMVLERLEDAQARKAPIQGKLLGAGMTSDSHHLAAPDPEGSRASEAMTKALQSANMSTIDITMISAHATGTELGDLAESRAIIKAFGSASQGLWVTAPKASLGHLIGAAGAVETILTLKALQQRLIPHSLNCTSKDPMIPLRIPRNSNIDMGTIDSPIAVKNAFGFGGHNVSLVISSDKAIPSAKSPKMA